MRAWQSAQHGGVTVAGACRRLPAAALEACRLRDTTINQSQRQFIVAKSAEHYNKNSTATVAVIWSSYEPTGVPARFRMERDASCISYKASLTTISNALRLAVLCAGVTELTAGVGGRSAGSRQKCANPATNRPTGLSAERGNSLCPARQHTMGTVPCLRQYLHLSLQ